MIQRIQSLFLLISSLFFSGLFLFPFANSNEAAPEIFADQMYTIMDHPVLLGLTILAIILALANIFVFKNRSLQLKLGYLIITAGFLLIILATLLMLLEGGEMNTTIEITEDFGIGMPILGIVMTFLAIRYIKKDTKLVKSMDRLR